MKLKRAVIADNVILATGSELQIVGTESFVCNGKTYDLTKLPIAAVEGNGSEIAEMLCKQLSAKYPNGFSKHQLEQDYGDKIADCVYAVLQVDDEHMLMLKTKSDEAIELYLHENNGIYKLTGEYHVASDASQGMSLESEVSLLTKGTLAIRGLVANIATVLEDLPSIDRPELIRILRIASQSVSSGSSKTFISSVGTKYTI